MTRRRPLGMLEPVLRRFRVLVLGLLAVSACAGCSSGTETGNPSFTAELSYTAYSSVPEVVGVHTRASRAVVESAWLDLDRVGLSTVGSCGLAAPAGLTVPGLGVGDHASGLHNVTRFEVTASDYCALDLPFVQVPAGVVQPGAPAGLERHSVMIAGTLADGTPFTVRSAATPTVHLVADQASFEMRANSANLLIAFDVGAWLDLNFDTATRTAGSIQISSDANAALLAQFEANLARGVGLYRDRDGDGKLDPLPERLAHGQ